jgi:hypothetical protein
MTTATGQDSEHLRLLSIFHYIVGGLMALSASVPIVHVIVGTMFLRRPETLGIQPNSFPADLVGALLVIIGSLIILLGWSLAALLLFAGRFLSQRSHYTYCIVIAALSCVFFPFGTVLGVLTLIVLLRPSVKPLFT